jgi:tetratricopeptide (TPR) repeat protein
LFEQSAYHLARNKLRQGAIGDVREICAHVAAAHGGSPRLLNLKLQIERGFVEEYALASAGLLTRYGYQIDGFAGIKPLPTEDLATERQRESLRQAVTQYPDCVELRINYGQLLLEQSRKVEAREQFQAARRLAPENVWALLGLGLTEFDLGQPAAALEHFQELLRLAPEMVAAHVDAAAAAQQAGQPKLAEQYWRSALDAIATQPPSEQDARLRQEIERQLARDRGPERMGWNEPK